MFGKFITLTLLAGFLSACATQEDFEAKLSSWVGHSGSELISSWGPPHRVYESGGQKYLTWSSSGTMVIPGSSPSYNTTFIGSTAYTTPIGGSSPMAINLSCEKTMTLENGYITTWRWQGNNCW